LRTSGSGKTVPRVVIRSSQDRNWSRRWKIAAPLPSLFVSRATFRPAIISFYEISRAYPVLPAASLCGAHMRMSNFNSCASPISIQYEARKTDTPPLLPQ